MPSQIDPSLAVYCEGGKAPPRNCANEFYTNSVNYTQCVCKEKYYEDGVNGCVLCPLGHYCIKGEKRQCAAHTYQDNTGQSSCKSCTSDGTAEGIYVGCSAKQQREWCNEGTVTPTCVSCAQCKKSYVPGTTSQVPCYRNA